MINGWRIEEMEPGWDFRFRAIKGNRENKFYSREAAERFASVN